MACDSQLLQGISVEMVSDEKRAGLAEDEIRFVVDLVTGSYGEWVVDAPGVEDKKLFHCRWGVKWS